MPDSPSKRKLAGGFLVALRGLGGGAPGFLGIPDTLGFALYQFMDAVLDECQLFLAVLL